LDCQIFGLLGKFEGVNVEQGLTPPNIVPHKGNNAVAFYKVLFVERKVHLGRDSEEGEVNGTVVCENVCHLLFTGNHVHLDAAFHCHFLRLKLDRCGVER